MARLTGEQLKDSYQNLLTIDATIESDPLTGQLENGLGNAITALGIGTDSPASPLTISRTNQAGSNEYIRLVGGSAGSLTFGVYPSSGSSLSFIGSNANYTSGGISRINASFGGSLLALNQDAIIAYVSSGVADPTEAMRIDSSGNVGVGVSPNRLLHLYGGADTTWLLMNNAATGSASTDGFSIAQVGADVTFINRETGYISFQTSDVPRMTIDSSGQVGIGGTPTTVLDVFSSGSALRLNSPDANGSYATFSNNGTPKGYIGSAYHILSSPSNNANDLAIRAEGNLLFASGGSTEKMRIDSGGDTTHIASYGGGTFPFRVGFGTYASFTPTFLIDDTGAVGIGNTSPSYALDVTGDIALSNDLYVSNGNFIKLQRNSGGLYLDVLGTPSGTDDVRLLTSGAFDIVNGSLTSMLKVDSSGNVGIGQANPSVFAYSSRELHVKGGTGTNESASFIAESAQSASGFLGGYYWVNGSATDEFQKRVGQITLTAGTNADRSEMDFLVKQGVGNYSTAMRIDSSGNLLVGKTSADDFSSAGAQIESGGQITTSVAGAPSLRLNRGTDDGDIIEFNRAGSEVGSIGAVDGQLFIGNEAGSVDSGLLFGEAGTTARAIIPSRAEGTVLDNALDLGYASGRFKDLYLGGNAYANGFYQNGSVTDNLVISQGTGTSRPSVGLWGNDHASFPGQVHIVSNSSNADADSGEIRFYDFTGSAFQINMTIDKSGNVDVAGALSKGSGSFKIDHPLESKKDTHYLVHSFVESPQANNIYRGSVDLADGQATVNLDEVSGMTDGTFVLLNTDIHVYTSNESDWDAVKGSVSDNVLTIECQNSSSNAKVNWLVIGERHDQHMIETNWTDENGKVIVEPLKPIENELEN